MNLSKHEIIDLLLGLGYSINLNPNQNHIATHDIFNVRISWKESNGGYIASLYTKRFKRSKMYMTYPIQDELITTESIKRIINARGYVTDLSLNNLPEPFDYRSDTYKLIDGEWVMIAILKQAKVVRIGGITESLSISDDIISDPRIQPWYVISATTSVGPKVDFISTDKSWYPINRFSKKITTDIRPHPNVDLTQLSMIDFELVSRAISEFNGSL